MLGYNGPNDNGPANAFFKKPIDDADLLALAIFMQNSGAVLATGDIPQFLRLLLIPGDHHPAFEIRGSKVMRQFPDHMHEGETVGFSGVETAEPWTLEETLVFSGKPFIEYPRTQDGQYQETPQVIAMGTVIDGHSTGADFLSDMEAFFLNCVLWMAKPGPWKY